MIGNSYGHAPRRVFALAAVALVALAAPALAQPPAASASSSALPTGPGRTTMVKVCSACHSPEIAATQRHDAKGWAEVVQLMASRGATASDTEFNEIIDYLARSFPATPATPVSSQGAHRPSTR